MFFSTGSGSFFSRHVLFFSFRPFQWIPFSYGMFFFPTHEIDVFPIPHDGGFSSFLTRCRSSFSPDCGICALFERACVPFSFLVGGASEIPVHFSILSIWGGILCFLFDSSVLRRARFDRVCHKVVQDPQAGTCRSLQRFRPIFPLAERVRWRVPASTTLLPLKSSSRLP